MKEFKYNGENFIYYDPDEIGEILPRISKPVNSRHKIKYYNIACSFDIETSSFYTDLGEKRACMYVWQFAIEDYVFIGRTWEEFQELVKTLEDFLFLHSKRRLVIYVHNLAYEFQWIRRWFEWERVFSLDTRKPLSALTKNGIEFRCSMRLSGYSLAALAGNIQNYPYKKLVGDLDYSLLRHSKTELTIPELAYSIRDVQIVIAYIQDKIKSDGNITKIPLTKTGYVRIECRKSCYGGTDHRSDEYKKYREIMDRLTLEPHEYELLKAAFQGGFTHANPYIVKRCLRGTNGEHYIKNVGSYDITSSYPYVMVAENGFPMGKGILRENCTLDDLKRYMELYACLIDISYYKIEDKIFIDNPISESRCTEIENSVLNNGRVVSADLARVVITNIDYEIIEACYTWETIEINEVWTYQRGYLPKNFIKQVLEFYKAKTKLKGLKGEENERRYLWGKEMVNATFGCAVTDPCRDEILYEEGKAEEWGSLSPDLDEAIQKYNKSKNRFLFYPWGVFITAYARRRLWGMILACGTDYCYADTDSVKIQNPDRYDEYFKKSDAIATKKLKRACEEQGFSWDDVAPKTSKGERKQLGVWEYEQLYHKFRTNGAKRYMVEYPGALDVGDTIYDLSLTVSGLNKRKAIPFLKQTYGNNDEIFAHFTNDLTIPEHYSGRNVSTYIDIKTSGEIIDYNGISGEYHELSSLHLGESTYKMDYAHTYERYLSALDVLTDWENGAERNERRLSIE